MAISDIMIFINDDALLEKGFVEVHLKER